jgi:Acetyl-coenzyme A transporter 1
MNTTIFSTAHIRCGPSSDVCLAIDSLQSVLFGAVDATLLLLLQGGAYLTLLNTIANMGVTLPKLAIFAVMDLLSDRTCVGAMDKVRRAPFAFITHPSECPTGSICCTLHACLQPLCCTRRTKLCCTGARLCVPSKPCRSHSPRQCLRHGWWEVPPAARWLLWPELCGDRGWRSAGAVVQGGPAAAAGTASGCVASEDGSTEELTAECRRHIGSSPRLSCQKFISIPGVGIPGVSIPGTQQRQSALLSLPTHYKSLALVCTKPASGGQTDIHSD